MSNLLSIKDIASKLRVADGTIRTWISRQQMPAPDIKGHRFVRWKQETLDDFLENPLLWREKNSSKLQDDNMNTKN